MGAIVYRVSNVVWVILMLFSRIIAIVGHPGISLICVGGFGSDYINCIAEGTGGSLVNSLGICGGTGRGAVVAGARSRLAVGVVARSRASKVNLVWATCTGPSKRHGHVAVGLEGRGASVSPQSASTRMVGIIT